MNFPEIYSATGMMELIQKIGFLPLLDSSIEGFSAEDIVAEDCSYVRLPEDCCLTVISPDRKWRLTS